MSKTIALSLALSLTTGLGAFAQQPLAARQTSLASAPAGYALGAGDVISIQVINFPELSVQQATVPPDGKVSVPLLGALPVTGRTTESIARTLTKRWGDYVVNPSVSVQLVQKRKETIQVFGAVTRPDTVEFQPDLHVLEAVAKTGGFDPQSDPSTVTVTHRNGQRQIVNLSHPEVKGGTDQDIILDPSDVVYVPQRHTQISVLGEVEKPGNLEYKENMNVLDALGGAGGIIQGAANLSGATLIHNGKQQSLNLDALLLRGSMSNNITLAPGDSIVVPELHNRTYVFGAVAKPGYYSFQPGDRVLDALNGSGGPLQTADLGKVNVIHISQDKQTAQPQTVDIGKFLTKGDMQANVPLAVGDVVYVPDKKHGASPFGILSGLGLIANTARLLVGL